MMGKETSTCATSTPSIISFRSAITTRCSKSPAGQKDIGKRVRGIPALSDIDLRLKVVEQFPDYTQVLSHGLPPIERLFGPDKSPEMAKIANDGLPEVVAKHPKHFVGWSAMLPMNAPDAAAKEAERVLKNGANAIQIGTNANGEPLDEQEVLADLRDHRQVRQADPAASGAHARDAGLSDREGFEIRDLQRARLALRDRRDAGALRVLRHHRPQSRASPSSRTISAA